MELLKEQSETEAELNRVVRRFYDDFSLFPSDELISHILDILSDDIGDENDTLSYFAYERGWNTRKQPCYYENDGAPIPTNTWEEIYDLITGGRENDG